MAAVSRELPRIAQWVEPAGVCVRPVEHGLPRLSRRMAYARQQGRRTGGLMAWLGERLPRVAHGVREVERRLALICRM